MSLVTEARPDAPSRSTIWDPAAAALVCVGVRREGPAVKTFSLAPADGSRVRFSAGQNLTLEWTMPDGEVVHRTFTIASPPTLASHVELTIKAQPDGRVTQDLHRRLRKGRRLKAYGPGGRFCLAHNPSEKVLMVAGGSGVTPIMSMLRWVRDRGYEIDLAVIVAARTPRDLLFADELAALDQGRARVRAFAIVSDVPAGERWLGMRGRVGRRLLTTLVPDAKHREVFCCGPEGFMQTVRRALRAEGMDMARYHEETFGAHGAVATPPPACAIPAEGITMRLSGRDRTVPVEPRRTVYENLHAAGIVVPTGCRSGICGTCKVRKTAGTVSMVHQGGLSAREEAAGHILACCSYATGDLTLDL